MQFLLVPAARVWLTFINEIKKSRIYRERIVSWIENFQHDLIRKLKSLNVGLPVAYMKYHRLIATITRVIK